MGKVSFTRSIGPYRILCVDDNEIGLFVNATILRSQGYDVLTCSDPFRAAEIANSTEIDVVVLDYQMPLMNGVELAALCRAANPDIKVILFSGWHEISNLELAVVDLFVQKSESPHSLLEGIEALLMADKRIVSDLQMNVRQL